MFIFWIYSIQIGIDLFTYVFIHVFICLLFIYLPIYLVLFWGVFFSYCKLVKLDGTSTLENGTKCVSHSARKKTKTNAGGIPNSEQRDITLGAILLRKHYYGWRAQAMMAVGEESHCSHWIFAQSCPDCLTPSLTIFTSWAGPCWTWHTVFFRWALTFNRKNGKIFHKRKQCWWWTIPPPSSSN